MSSNLIAYHYLYIFEGLNVDVLNSVYFMIFSRRNNFTEIEVEDGSKIKIFNITRRGKVNPGR